MINPTTIIQTDDIKAFKEFVSTLPDFINTKVNLKDGKRVSLLWIAAWLNAGKIVGFLLTQGADPSSVIEGADAITIAFGGKKFSACRALIEHGIEFDAMKQISLLRDNQSFVPASDMDILLHDIMCALPDRHDWSDIEAAADDIVGTSPFQTAFPRVDMNLDFVLGQAEFGEELNRSTAGGDSEPARAIAAHILGAYIVIAEFNPKIRQIIMMNFFGFENKRSWLSKAKSRSIQEVAKYVAPMVGGYEDGDAVVWISSFIVTQFPVREILSGQRIAPPRKDITGRAFEAECAEVLEEAGFEVRQVGGTGDQGADLIARKDGLSFALQCKDYEVPVGNSACQEAVASARYYTCDFGVVVSRSGFTKSAHELGRTVEVFLVSLQGLSDLTTLVRASAQ